MHVMHTANENVDMRTKISGLSWQAMDTDRNSYQEQIPHLQLCIHAAPKSQGQHVLAPLLPVVLWMVGVLGLWLYSEIAQCRIKTYPAL